MFELLQLLIERRPAVVTNNELDELLWPTVYVARTSLTRLVSELRTVLGDTPRDSRIIRTAYKTGYAFCADVICTPSVVVPPATLELVWKKHILPLTEGEHVAGRDSECSLTIDSRTVSRQHARITVLASAVTIEDLASTNGTRINGARVSAATRLAAGDEVSLGGETLQVRLRNGAGMTIKVDGESHLNEK
jgi:hypothetical protein